MSSLRNADSRRPCNARQAGRQAGRRAPHAACERETETTSQSLEMTCDALRAQLTWWQTYLNLEAVHQCRELSVAHNLHPSI